MWFPRDDHQVGWEQYLDESPYSGLPLQEVSLSSGWGQEFLNLATRFDRAIAKAFGEDVFAQLGRFATSWR